MIKIDYEKGNGKPEDLQATRAKLTEYMAALDGEFDGPALDRLKAAADELSSMLGEYCVPVVAVSNGITVNRLKRGDVIQTLDRGASQNGGRITGFGAGNTVVEYMKSNGQKATAHVTYVRLT